MINENDNNKTTANITNDIENQCNIDNSIMDENSGISNNRNTNIRKGSNRSTSLILCSLFVALMSISSYIKIPTPLLPVTLQTAMCMLTVLTLGQKRAFVAIFCFIMGGLIGLPLFSSGGGFSYVFRVTFGYLIGFLLSTLVVGALIKNKKYTFRNCFVATIFGVLVVHIVGTTYMYFLMNYYLVTPISIGKAMLVGSIMFLPTDIILSALACVLAIRSYPFIAKL